MQPGLSALGEQVDDGDDGYDDADDNGDDDDDIWMMTIW